MQIVSQPNGAAGGPAFGGILQNTPRERERERERDLLGNNVHDGGVSVVVSNNRCGVLEDSWNAEGKDARVEGVGYDITHI